MDLQEVTASKNSFHDATKQSASFIEAAHELGGDESEEAFARAVRKVASAKLKQAKSDKKLAVAKN